MRGTEEGCKRTEREGKWGEKGRRGDEKIEHEQGDRKRKALLPGKQGWGLERPSAEDKNPERRQVEGKCRVGKLVGVAVNEIDVRARLGDKERWPLHSPPKLIEDTSAQATKTELLWMG